MVTNSQEMVIRLNLCPLFLRYFNTHAHDVLRIVTARKYVFISAPSQHCMFDANTQAATCFVAQNIQLNYDAITALSIPPAHCGFIDADFMLPFLCRRDFCSLTWNNENKALLSMTPYL